jgi:hypothetical protein
MARMETFLPVAMLIPFLVWLGIVVFMIMLALRLVKGVERIANALERRP